MPVFFQERELVAALKPLIHSALRPHCREISCQKLTPTTFEQIPIGMIIPDLVLIWQPKEGTPYDRRVNVSHLESWILAELYWKGPRNERTISEALSSRERTILQALGRLKKAGVVQKKDSGEFFVTDHSIPSETIAISIEAKLKNWREAVRQAERYLAFSNYSFIALPAPVIRNNEEVRLICEDKGIGVLSVNPRTLRVALPARYNFALDPDWLYLLAKTIGFVAPQPSN